MIYLILILILVMFSGGIGMVIGSLANKHNEETGALLGACLGPIGWIITAVLPQSDKAPKNETIEKNPDAKRIAALEAQIAEIKHTKNVKPKSVISKRPDDDDSGIPTYKL